MIKKLIFILLILAIVANTYSALSGELTGFDLLNAGGSGALVVLLILYIFDNEE